MDDPMNAPNWDTTIIGETKFDINDKTVVETVKSNAGAVDP
jgi:hypothetical protein